MSALREALISYEDALMDLRMNSKPVISNLTIIAEEIYAAHGEVGAAEVAAAIDQRINAVCTMYSSANIICLLLTYSAQANCTSVIICRVDFG
mmetsp:Transcript_1426/g.4857  ORF Transcript_1426/g.4857 Transcript_1426/m.4857 type:complete len:93 (-) Transcript_1426:2263-2541(-)